MYRSGSSHVGHWMSASGWGTDCPDVFLTQWFGELVHSQGYVKLGNMATWWAWTLTPPVVPQGGAV